MKDIFYKVIGNGFPIVLLHGNGENHHIFDETVKVLSQTYQCILIDSRYHGKSIKSGKLTYQLMCDDVKNVVSELDISEYDMIGFSDGGIIALLLSMQDTRLKHMIVMGANTKPCYLKPMYRYPMYLSLVCLLPFCIYNKKARKQFLLTRLMLKEPNIEYQQLSSVSAPTLVLAGQYDMIKETDTLKIGESLLYGIVKIIKQGTHSLLRDSFKQTMKEIEAFLYACHQED